MNKLQVVYVIIFFACVTAIFLCLMISGCSSTDDIRYTPYAERAYDPNAPELSFLEPAEPNWTRDYGDTRQTLELYNLSKLRAMVLRDEKIMSIIAQRLIRLEGFHPELAVDPNDPNGVKE